MPFFSIVVVSLNAEKEIVPTIKSILIQTFNDYEIIVKDGESTDGTVLAIPSSDKIKTVVQRDRGVYDAMNQGIRQATGDYVCFLNCGDEFYSPSVLSDMYEAIRQKQTEGIYYGNYETKGLFVQCPATTTRRSLYRNPLCHQTMFIPRALFECFGEYRSDFRILADYEFTVHCLNEKIELVNTGITVCKYLGGGISTQKKYKKVIKSEYKTARHTYYPALERYRYELKNALTLPWIRVYFASERAPKWLNKLYNKISNTLKKKV